MKKIVGIFAIGMLVSLSALGQERQTVYSITQERHEIPWYEEQLSLWEKYVEEHQYDAPAWYNYYSSARAIKNLNWEDREEYKNWGKECTKIAEAAYKAVPNSFEGNHIIWWDSGNDEAKREFLMRAHEIAPDDTRAFDDLMIYYELNRNGEKFSELCLKIYESGELPASILNWGYNVLSELDENAIVFTSGDNDTYALWLVQQVKGFRKDVIVINSYLITLKDYQEKIFAELGLPEFEGEIDGVHRAIFDNEKEIPVYVDVCGIKFFEKDSIMDDVYLTGLAYKYSKDDVDNVSLIRRNYEKRYLLDYLTHQFSTHQSDGVADSFSELYLPSLIKLYKHYHETEEQEKKAVIEVLLLKIGKKFGQIDTVQELIKDC
ncbi:MAG: hypothetical protein P8P74_06065 [Crocinitomicaceae bacterium]|nr:hypothetical protein [Crocinitomicaceae bacterium]